MESASATAPPPPTHLTQKKTHTKGQGHGSSRSFIKHTSITILQFLSLNMQDSPKTQKDTFALMRGAELPKLSRLYCLITYEIMRLAKVLPAGVCPETRVHLRSANINWTTKSVISYFTHNTFISVFLVTIATKDLNLHSKQNQHKCL